MFGQGGASNGKDGGKKKVKNNAGDAGGRAEVSNKKRVFMSCTSVVYTL